MILKLLVDAGEMKPSPAMSQKLGPMGINMGKVISEVNNSTKDFKGMKVPVELDIDPKTKNFKIAVKTPPTSELLKKEAGLEKASGEQKKIKVANLAMEQIIKVAKTKQNDMLDKDMKSKVKSVLGSCASLGIMVENHDAKRAMEQVNSGKFDKEINSESTEVSEEKSGSLKRFFSQIQKEQEEMLKREAEAKAAEEAAEAAAETGATEEKAEEKAEGAEPAAEEEKKEEKE